MIIALPVGGQTGRKENMKLYRIENILELLEFEKEENSNEYVGFEINDSGNLVMIFKEHEPNYPEAEAVLECELLESAGKY